MEQNDITISAHDVAMRFRLTDDKILSLKEFVTRKIRGKIKTNEFWALKGVSFDVQKGEVLGIIGRNGSGKSTLLKCISGILKPTRGSVTCHGNIVPMLELGSGFDLDLTGRENVFLNGAILGYTEEFLKEKFDEIHEFSELGDFIDVPIRNYSSGLDGGLGGLHDAVTLQGGDLHDLAAQLTAQLRHVDLVAVLADHVHHVDGDDHGNAQLGELGGQVQVALQVRAIDDVQDGIGALLDQVVTGHHLLQRVGGQGVDAGQVHDGHIIMLLQLALFLLHGNAGPVAHELVRAGQRVEQGGLAGVGVACQRDLDLFVHIVPPFG